MSKRLQVLLEEREFREIRPIFGGRGAQKRSHHSPRAAMAAPVSSTISRPVRMM